MKSPADDGRSEGAPTPAGELSTGEGGLDRGQRVGLVLLVAIPLIPVGYGVGTLILETVRELLK